MDLGARAVGDEGERDEGAHGEPEWPEPLVGALVEPLVCRLEEEERAAAGRPGAKRAETTAPRSSTPTRVRAPGAGGASARRRKLASA